MLLYKKLLLMTFGTTLVLFRGKGAHEGRIIVAALSLYLDPKRSSVVITLLLLYLRKWGVGECWKCLHCVN